MSRMTKSAKRDVVKETVAEHKDAAVVNFMGGTSYTLNPLDTLRIIAASSIFGEPSYYRKGDDTESYLSKLSGEVYVSPSKSTTSIFTKSIRDALDYSIDGTLELAKVLRHEYNMRLNPSIIFVEAALHKNRAKFNNENPKRMRQIGSDVIVRPDDIMNQFGYYKYLTHSKKKLPGILKKVWADKLSSFDRYQLSKYQTSGMLVDMVRISHAKSDLISEMMQLNGGVLPLEEGTSTWERLRSEGKTWIHIFDTIKIPHMALLRNLRGMFEETNDAEFAKKVSEYLKAGVKGGRQFPFRYKTARDAISESKANHKIILMDALEECIDIAMSNFPRLKGKVVCLSDNSGSAWGAFNSEYGSVKVAEIDNLSSVMTAYNSDEGYVGVFGDRLEMIPVSKRNGILSQTDAATAKGKLVGQATENGIWLFWDNAIKSKEHWDTVFIYSDMQAGHGGLYGSNPNAYKKYSVKGSYIDVLALVAEYRRVVNPKVNVFSVQTAGYNNSVLPENLYRGAILSGWTGKEAQYAQFIIDAWNDVESRKQ